MADPDVDAAVAALRRLRDDPTMPVRWPSVVVWLSPTSFSQTLRALVRAALTES